MSSETGEAGATNEQTLGTEQYEPEHTVLTTDATPSSTMSVDYASQTVRQRIQASKNSEHNIDMLKYKFNTERQQLKQNLQLAMYAQQMILTKMEQTQHVVHGTAPVVHDSTYHVQSNEVLLAKLADDKHAHIKLIQTDEPVTQELINDIKDLIEKFKKILNNYDNMTFEELMSIQ